MPLPKKERVVWDKFPNRIHVCHLYVTLKGILFVWMSSVGIWHWTTLIKKGGWLQGVAFSGFEPLELINQILGRKDALGNTCYTLHSDSLTHIRIYIYIHIQYKIYVYLDVWQKMLQQHGMFKFNTHTHVDNTYGYLRRHPCFWVTSPLGCPKKWGDFISNMENVFIPSCERMDSSFELFFC